MSDSIKIPFCDTSLSAKSVELIWKIPQYSHRKQIFASGQKIWSPEYVLKRSDKSCSVTVNFYLDLFCPSINESSDSEKWISIFVRTKGEQLCQHVHHIQIALLDQAGNEFISNRFHRKVPFPSEGWGWKKFFRQSVLENPVNNLLPDDTLTFSCQIEETDGESEICECPKETAQTIGIWRRLVEDLGTLLQSKTSSDVQFMVKKVKISAHKNILASRSPVFADLLRQKIQENKTKTIKIHDVQPDVFNQLLQFIYTGQCEVPHSAENLFIAAEKYEIQELKEICEKDLQKKLVLDNAVHLLDFSDTYQAKNLKESVLVFIKKNAVELVKKAATCELTNSIKKLFIAGCKHNIQELKETSEEVLQKKLTLENAVQLLVWSDTYKAKNLKESALVFINKNAIDLVKQPSWNDMVETHPTLINELYMKGLGMKQS
jgi:BTB/POZ domain